jgi:hypothetical protein
MNFIYYLIGSFFTFIGIIIYKFFIDGAVVIDTNFITNFGLIALIAGAAFFLADWLMQKVGK